MSPDPYPQIIDLNEQPKKNRFPIVMQLGVLGLVMVLLFGALAFKPEPETRAIAPAQTLPPSNPSAAATGVVLQKLENDIFLTADAAYVWDVRAQRALFEKNATEPLPLASITKLMTALLAHELITEDESATVSISAIRQEGSSGMYAGEQLTALDLRELALISSSNDAAYQLAASVGELLGDQDPVAQFVLGMNIRAEELGLETLEFKNTTGLDVNETVPGAVGSAKDVSFLMEHIVDTYPEILAPTREIQARVYNEAGEYHEIENTNEVVSQIPGLIGSKTGFTDLAGGNLTIAFNLGLDRPIIVTVLGSTREQRFTDVLTLVEAVQDSVD